MADEIIAHPTYMEHIRHFFEEIDLDHMNAQGVDLSTYAQLSARANDVYLHTLQPDGDMPPEPDRKWSAERSASFLNWITDRHAHRDAVARVGRADGCLPHPKGRGEPVRG